MAAGAGCDGGGGAHRGVLLPSSISPGKSRSCNRVRFEVVWDTHDLAEEGSPYFPWCNGGAGKWAAMDAEISDLCMAELGRAGEARHLGLHVPASAPSASRASAASLRVEPGAAVGVAAAGPPRDGYSSGEAVAGWDVHERDGAWLYKSSARTYFHVPSETLWRLDASTGAPVRLEAIQFRSLSAFDNLQNRHWLRFSFFAWISLARSRGAAMPTERQAQHHEKWSRAVVDPQSGRDLVADALANAMRALEGFDTGNAQSARDVVFRLLRLSEELDREWAAQQRKAVGLLAEATRIGGASAAAFSRTRLRGVFDRVSSDDRPGDQDAEQHGCVADDGALKFAVARDRRFRRLRGALLQGAAVWGGDAPDAHKFAGGSAATAQSPAKKSLAVLNTLDAVYHALPGEVHATNEDLQAEKYAGLSELPSALRVALRHLGPL
mmetsp:Transcript_13321/g.35731  ORF Transcript_13321/g.35731 Transcript_13321/m.35731 type:complete len:438 (-) Transcript_13321:145-1458(-)